jgi:hypothetical protein
MGDQLVEFFEGILVQQQFYALASRELALLVLPLVARVTSALIRRSAPALKLIQPIHRNRARSWHLL